MYNNWRRSAGCVKPQNCRESSLCHFGKRLHAARPDSFASFQDAVPEMHAIDSGQLHDRQATYSRCRGAGNLFEYHGGDFYHRQILDLFSLYSIACSSIGTVHSIQYNTRRSGFDHVTSFHSYRLLSLPCRDDSGEHNTVVIVSNPTIVAISKRNS